MDKKIMDEFTIGCLVRLVDYVEDDERKDWESNGQPLNHVYNDIGYLQDWLAQNNSELPQESEAE